MIIPAKERRRRLRDRAIIERAHLTLPGFDRSTMAELLQAEAETPLRGGAAPPRYDSLFGEGLNQAELRFLSHPAPQAKP